MAFIQEKDQIEIQKRFNLMQQPVKIINFSQEIECTYCRETRQLMEEVAALSDKISLEVHNYVINKEQADKYHVDKIPATIIMGEKDYGIRFYGIPSGYEFSTLLDDIVMVSKGDSGLSDDSKKILSEISESLHLQVFVTPTCPYCPAAVYLAHQLAFEKSDLIRGDMIEATEFPHLSHHYNVGAVPKIVINDKVEFEGALPEKQYLDKLIEATNKV